MHAVVALWLLGATNYLTPLSEVEQANALAWIATMKANARGPYAGVSWFCNDGAILPPKSYACVEHGGGFQYGVLSREARRLGDMGIYVGTVLQSLEAQELIRDHHYRSRALIVEYYLERALGGWVLQSAQNYRGFRQIEDEREAARWLLMEQSKSSSDLRHRRSLVLRLMRALPYGRHGSLADTVRTLAGVLGDADLDFADLRFKIHAMPEPSDIDDVLAYAATKGGELKAMALELVDKMKLYYDAASRFQRLNDVRQWIWNKDCKKAIKDFIDIGADDPMASLQHGTGLIEMAAGLLRPTASSRAAERNLLLLHVMALVEELSVALTAPLAQMPLSRLQALDVVEQLVGSAGHVALLSPREVAGIKQALAGARTGDVKRYADGIAYASRSLEWARARLLSDLFIALARYGRVERRAYGVIDDILRSGVMLPLAATLDRLNADVERLRGGGHRIAGLSTETTAGVRGENPGLAVGRLNVLAPGGDPRRLGRHEVVLLQDLPPELPPVAGIVTLGAAGSLSHVALLARNLGIPHAAVGGDIADALLSLRGKEVLLGVSAGGRVALGPKTAFATVKLDNRGSTKHTKPFLRIDEAILDLKTTRIHHLSEVSPRDSGVKFGPKAAELGGLAKLFPDRVSDAVVIPFGAFLRHVDRPGEDGTSPLAQLRQAYHRAKGLDPDTAETQLLKSLSRFRAAIVALPFVDEFEPELDQALSRLGRVGTFGVFVRSDTNVEDLKEFTGAGLNKTVPNRTRRDSILAAIRKVWASPYTERSFRWRQRILHNPEYVFPSVILHRTVPSEISGVMVTTDLEGKSRGAITVSASEGVAAVVDGGSPETIVVEDSGQVRLLASSRSATCKTIPRPPTEGINIATSVGHDPLLGDKEIAELVLLASEAKRRIPAQDGLPWDIEFGFWKGKAYLMQIRPLRASRSAATNPFLKTLDVRAALPAVTLDLDEKVP